MAETPIQMLTLLKNNETKILLTKDVKSQVQTQYIDIIYH